MIPVERVAELLHEHRYDPYMGLRDCMCGWQEGDDYHGSHASHVAGVLADAGLIPTEQEWGVDGYDGITSWGAGHQDSAIEVAAAVDGTVVTRHVAATEWAPAE